MNEIRENLRQLLITRSLQIGHFTLTSGITSTHYIDAKKTTLDPEGAYLCARLILDELARNQVDAEAIGGLTLGADPVVAAVAAVSFAERDRYTPLPAFIVRKEAKKHGTQLYIEGFEGEKGSRIVIFDDVCTTAASALKSIEKAEAQGYKVASVICLVDREQGAEENLRGYSFLRLFRVQDLLSDPSVQEQLARL